MGTWIGIEESKKMLSSYPELQQLHELAISHYGESRVSLNSHNRSGSDPSDRVELWIHYPTITIENSQGNKRLLRDIYVCYLIDKHGILIEGPLYTRSTYTYEEALAGYRHSHLPGVSSNPDNRDRFHALVTACYGSGPILGTFSCLTSDYDINYWKLCFMQMDSYLAWESLEGGPYRQLTRIRGQALNAFNSLYRGSNARNFRRDYCGETWLRPNSKASIYRSLLGLPDGSCHNLESALSGPNRWKTFLAMLNENENIAALEWTNISRYRYNIEDLPCLVTFHLVKELLESGKLRFVVRTISFPGNENPIPTIVLGHTFDEMEFLIAHTELFRHLAQIGVNDPSFELNRNLLFRKLSTSAAYRISQEEYHYQTTQQENSDDLFPKLLNISNLPLLEFRGQPVTIKVIPGKVSFDTTNEAETNCLGNGPLVPYSKVTRLITSIITKYVNRICWKEGGNSRFSYLQGANEE